MELNLYLLKKNFFYYVDGTMLLTCCRQVKVHQQQQQQQQYYYTKASGKILLISLQRHYKINSRSEFYFRNLTLECNMECNARAITCFQPVKSEMRKSEMSVTSFG